MYNTAGAERAELVCEHSIQYYLMSTSSVQYLSLCADSLPIVSIDYDCVCDARLQRPQVHACLRGSSNTCQRLPPSIVSSDCSARRAFIPLWANKHVDRMSTIAAAAPALRASGVGVTSAR